MGDIIAFFQAFTPGAAGIWTLVVMFAAFLIREWRETRKLSAADRLARRDGYAKQVESLQAENRSLRADLRRAEEEHDRYRELCQEENSQLRHSVRQLEDRLAGLERQLQTAGIEAQRTQIRKMPKGSVSEAVRGAAERSSAFRKDSE